MNNFMQESGPHNKRGPVVFLTDDSDAEINGINAVWPESRNLLCLFHVVDDCGI